MIMISRLALLAGLEVELLDVVLLDLPQPIQAVLVPSDLPFVLLDLLQPIHIYRLYTYIQAVYDTVQNTSFSGILAFKCTVIKNNKNIVDL